MSDDLTEERSKQSRVSLLDTANSDAASRADPLGYGSKDTTTTEYNLPDARGQGRTSQAAMRVSDQYRMLFIHVQKTGGTSFDHMLDAEISDSRQIPGLDRHIGLSRILEREPQLASYWILGFVRNPWARMVSWWAMIEHVAASEAAGKRWAIKRTARSPWMAEAAACGTFENFVIEGARRSSGA